MKLNDIRADKKNSIVSCPLCRLEAKLIAKHSLGDYVGVSCENCSTYYLFGTVFDEFDDVEHTYLLSGYFRNHQPHFGEYTCYSTKNLKKIIASEKALDSDDRKMASLIFYYGNKISSLDEWFDLELYPAIAYCDGIEELIRTAKEAEKNGYIELSESTLKLNESGIRFSKEFIKKMRKETAEKPIKVFISHAGKDKAYVEELVKLFEFIGLKPENLFCSSVPGYHIPLGKGGIYDYLLNEFNTHDLFMIYVLSGNYYRSAACLNEMGAAWILKYPYYFRECISVILKEL